MGSEELEAALKRVQELEHEVYNHNEQYAAVTKAVQEAHQNIFDLTGKLKYQQEVNYTIEKEKINAVSKVSDLEAKLEAQIEENKEMSDNVEKLRSQVQEEKVRTEAAVQASYQLGRDLHSKIVDLEDRLGQRDEELAAMKAATEEHVEMASKKHVELETALQKQKETHQGQLIDVQSQKVDADWKAAAHIGELQKHLKEQQDRAEAAEEIAQKEAQEKHDNARKLDEALSAKKAQEDAARKSCLFSCTGNRSKSIEPQTARGPDLGRHGISFSLDPSAPVARAKGKSKAVPKPSPRPAVDMDTRPPSARPEVAAAQEWMRSELGQQKPVLIPMVLGSSTGSSPPRRERRREVDTSSPGNTFSNSTSPQQGSFGSPGDARTATRPATVPNLSSQEEIADWLSGKPAAPITGTSSAAPIPQIGTETPPPSSANSSSTRADDPDSKGPTMPQTMPNMKSSINGANGMSWLGGRSIPPPSWNNGTRAAA